MENLFLNYIFIIFLFITILVIIYMYKNNFKEYFLRVFFKSIF